MPRVLAQIKVMRQLKLGQVVTCTKLPTAQSVNKRGFIGFPGHNTVEPEPSLPLK